MSHLVRMIDSQQSHLGRIKQAHRILEMEIESTTEILIWNDPESVESFMNRVRSLVSSIVVSQIELDKVQSNGRSFSNYREEFVTGLDDFIVKAYQGQSSVIFVNTARAMLHYAWMFIEEDLRSEEAP